MVIPVLSADWYGITCDAAGSTITGISVSGNSLRGFLPSALGALTNLQTLDVGNYASTVTHFVNLLTGPIPSSLGTLSKLQTFIANNQFLTGPLPPLSGLSSLTFLDLRSNQITGSLPDLSGLVSLQTAKLSNNELSGILPSLDGLNQLSYLDITENKIEGLSSFGALPNLQTLWISYNQLRSPIPDMSGLTALVDFEANFNQITGPLPSLSGLINLKSFGVGYNNLSGTIPSLNGLTNLTGLALAGNRITGNIPDLSGQANLQRFLVAFNSLTGNVPALPVPLASGNASLCPNLLTPASDPPSTVDQAWNTATNTTPWSLNCTSSSTPTTTILSSSDGTPNASSDVGHPVTFTAQVYGNNPTGTVTFTYTIPLHSGTNTICDSVPLVDGVATCTTTGLLATGSTDNVSATYSGDANNAASHQFSPLGENVGYRITTTPSASTVQVGQPLDLVAKLDYGSASNTLTFYDGSRYYGGATALCSSVAMTTIGTQQVAHCTTSFATTGEHLLTVETDQQLPLDAPPIVLNVVATALVDADQFALTGTWYDPATSGQGVLAEVYPDRDSDGKALFGGGWFTFDGSGNPQWYTLQGSMTAAHGGAYALTIYQATGGVFNAPPAVDTTSVGSAALTFYDCTHTALVYQFNDGRSGTIPLSRLSNTSACSTAVPAVAQTPPPNYNDVLHSGAWYNPATSGQGLLFDIVPSQTTLFAAWYTYAPAAEGATGTATQRWFTLQTNAYTPGNLSLSGVPIYATSGGVFNAIAPVSITQVGTTDIVFISCNAMTLHYVFTDGEFKGLGGTIQTQTIVPIDACR